MYPEHDEETLTDHPGPQRIPTAAPPARSDVVAGSTGSRLERWSVGIALTYANLVPMIALLNMDAGVVFCRRVDFEAIGGYDENRPIGEDVAFLMALRKLGKGRRQSLVRLTEVKAFVSTRKFDQHGDWHFLLKIMPIGIPADIWPSVGRKSHRFVRWTA